MQNNFHKASQKSKKIAFIKLLILTRRYYLAFFFNIKIDKFVKIIFSNMKISHSQYKKTIIKMR